MALNGVPEEKRVPANGTCCHSRKQSHCPVMAGCQVLRRPVDDPHHERRTLRNTDHPGFHVAVGRRSAAGAALAHHRLGLKRHGDMAGYYFHIIGTLYAVLIAFAIYMVWSAYKTSGANLKHEATEVADLSRLSSGMPDGLRHDINTALLEYLNAVSQDEFPAMAQGRSSQRTWTAMQRVWEVYGNAQVDTPKVQGYFNESLKHLTQLSDLRRTRPVRQSRYGAGHPMGLAVGGGSAAGRLYLLCRLRKPLHPRRHDRMPGRCAVVLHGAPALPERSVLRIRQHHARTVPA